jgi:hypothetical protein
MLRETVFKKCQVVMLPIITTDMFLGVDYKDTKLSIKSTYDIFKEGIYYHLYVVSDDQIKDGDWYFNTDMRTKEYGVIKADERLAKLATNAPSCKKIIATTDSSLTIKIDGYRGDLLPDVSFDIVLPQPSQLFIERYVTEYNKGNVITESLVEYEDSVPKVNPNTNTIGIKKVKAKRWYKRDEVIELITKAVAESHDWSRDHNDIHSINLIEQKFLSKWIEENLID